MWEKLKGLSTGAKAGLVGGVALLAAAGVGLGIWQPWNQPEDVPDEPEVQQQEPAEVQKPAEKGLSVQVNGEKISCALYEGDGWSVYVPEGWTAEGLGNGGALFSAGDGAQMSVRLAPEGGYAGQYVNLSDGSTDLILEFYKGGSQAVSLGGNAPKGQWGQYEKLFVALARTLTVGEEKPFAESYIIPQEPDWQKAEGMTVLFLDKDGFVIDEKMRETIESHMLSWPAEAREDYTGQYRVNRIVWAGSYAGITKDGYIDVFRADVQYRLAEGASPEEVSIVDGWASTGNGIYLAISHDGGSVAKTQGIVTDGDVVWAQFAGLLN